MQGFGNCKSGVTARKSRGLRVKLGPTAATGTVALQSPLGSSLAMDWSAGVSLAVTRLPWREMRVGRPRSHHSARVGDRSAIVVS
jgi:hypothetical protein